MKKKGIAVAVAVVILAVLPCIAGVCVHSAFEHGGLDQGLVGQVAEDQYPAWDDWDDSQKVSELEWEIEEKSGLKLSKVYLIERADHYQVRFRIGGGIPFVHPALLEDTCWEIEDSEGNSYTSNMIVWAEQIAGLNCMNVTLLFDAEAFSGLSEKKLHIAAVCSEEGNGQTSVEESYAHCEARIILHNANL